MLVLFKHIDNPCTKPIASNGGAKRTFDFLAVGIVVQSEPGIGTKGMTTADLIQRLVVVV
jgi:hypothetical protein